ncbi:Zn finger-containing GTPase- Activating Protein for ARF [Microbotryomycetes sp. JL201]|nr:Zn finger-containing GTPase- Activating Protein for ARF [Microbotryomycetes sp. JL201]
MAYEYDTKAVLLEWMKQGENSKCFECNIPSPQWLSFVRSLTMDKWTPAQIKRMEVGGNKKCREFFEASPEYDRNMSMPDKYNTHFAAMYRDKLLAEAEGKSWSPEDTPAPAAPSSSGSNANGATRSSSLRNKPRIMTGSNRSGSPGMNSPARSGSPATPTYNQPASGTASSQKSANENYFARLGAANDSRPDNLPPSQGGKYGGFGSADSAIPSGGAYNSERLSSRALPSFEDIREDPVSAVSKGWGLFSAALGAVSKTVNDSVLQPTLERAGDPNLQSQLASYVTKGVSVLGDGARQGGQLLSSGLHSGSEYLKRDMGLDVGDLGAGYLDRATGRGRGQGYGYVGSEAPTAYDSREGTLGETADEFFAREMGGGGSGANAYRDDDSDGFDRSARSSNTASRASRTATPSSVPTIAGPEVPTDQDAWAKLAPQSVARARSTTPNSQTISRPSSAQNTTAPVSKTAAAKKKDDDWDDFQEADW